MSWVTGGSDLVFPGLQLFQALAGSGVQATGSVVIDAQGKVAGVLTFTEDPEEYARALQTALAKAAGPEMKQIAH